MAESRLTPAKPLLDYRQAALMQRLMARPKGYQGPEEVLEKRGSELIERLRQNPFLKAEKPEELGWARHRSFPGGIQIEDRRLWRRGPGGPRGDAAFGGMFGFGSSGGESHRGTGDGPGPERASDVFHVLHGKS